VTALLQLGCALPGRLWREVTQRILNLSKLDLLCVAHADVCRWVRELHWLQLMDGNSLSFCNSAARLSPEDVCVYVYLYICMCVHISQSHRRAEVGRHLCRSSSPNPCSAQRQPQQVTQGHLQSGFECLQRLRLHNFSRQSTAMAEQHFL